MKRLGLDDDALDDPSRSNSLRCWLNILWDML